MVRLQGLSESLQCRTVPFTFTLCSPSHQFCFSLFASNLAQSVISLHLPLSPILHTNITDKNTQPSIVFLMIRGARQGWGLDLRKRHFSWLMLNSSHGHNWLGCNSWPVTRNRALTQIRPESWLFTVCVLANVFFSHCLCITLKDPMGDPEAVFQPNSCSRHGGEIVWGGLRGGGRLKVDFFAPGLNLFLKMTHNYSQNNLKSSTSWIVTVHTMTCDSTQVMGLWLRLNLWNVIPTHSYCSHLKINQSSGQEVIVPIDSTILNWS